MPKPSTKTGAAAPPQSKAISAADLISGMAKPKSASKKSSKPEYHNPELDDAIETYIEQTQIEKTAHALAGAAKDQILAEAGPARLAECVKAGEVHSSITVNGRLTMTQTSRYSVVPEEKAAELLDAFGDDDYRRFFKATLKIGLNEASANDESVLATIIEKLGPEFIAEHMEIRRDLLVQPAFHHDFSTKPLIQDLAQPFMDDQTIRPYSASLKIK